jgi:Radical SAM superfamily
VTGLPVRAENILLIHPPVAKPSEPPAGVARLAGALRCHQAPCLVIDANIEGLHYLLQTLPEPTDTWSRRACRHLAEHLQTLQSIQTYARPDVYRRAVSDINRLLLLAGEGKDARPGLADYHDDHLTPVRSADLIQAALRPERNPYFNYFRERVLPAVAQTQATMVGISINYLSQALCAFALVGLLKRRFPELKIVLGGGLATSWQRRPQWMQGFGGWIDRIVAGPGEAALLEMAGHRPRKRFYVPDFEDLLQNEYLSPGPVLPFSASDGCWWRRCAFCPEKAEGRSFRPLPPSEALRQLQSLAGQVHPTVIHLLDNALSPAMLKTLASTPPRAPWFGFARLVPPLDDPGFCSTLAASGCAMLQIGLESGDQEVLDSLDKGIRLKTASRILCNLKQAGIATYVYLLFGTPPEDPRAAMRTLDFTVDHHELIGFLNLALFNLPLEGSEFQNLRRRTFYPADLALYSDFAHPKGWDRSAVRRFIEKQFKKHPAIQPIIRRDPPIFTSNHAAFFSPMLHKKDE